VETQYEHIKVKNEQILSENNKLKEILEKGFEEKENELNYFKAKHEELREKKKKYEKILEEKENLIKKLTQEIERVKQDFLNYQSENELKSKFKQNEINKINSELSVCTSQNGKNKEEIQFNLNLIQELTEKLNKFQDDKVKNTEKIKEYETKCFNILNENIEIKTRMENLKITSKNRVDQLNLENKIVKEEKETLYNKIIEIQKNETSNNSLKKDLEEYKINNKILSSQINKQDELVQSLLKEHKDNINQYITKNKELCKEIEELNIDNYSLKKSLEEKDKDFKNYAQEKKIRIEFCESQISKYEALSSDMKTRLSESEKSLHLYKKKCEELENNKTFFEESLKNKDSLYENSIEMIEKLKKENKGLISRIDQIEKNNLDQLRHVNDSFDKKINDLTAKLELKDLEIVKLRDDYNQTVETYKRLNSKKSDKEGELETVKLQLDIKENNFIALQQKLQTLSEENTMINEKYNTLNDQVKRKESMIFNLNIEINDSKKELLRRIREMEELQVNHNYTMKISEEKFNTQINEQTNQMVKLEQLIADQKSSFTLQKEEINSKNLEKIKLEEIIEGLKKENEILKHENLDIIYKREEILELESLMRSNKEDYLEMISCLEKEKQKLELDHDDLLMKCNNNEERIKAALEENNILKSRKEAHVEELKVLKQTISNYEEKILVLESSLIESRLKIDVNEEKFNEIVRNLTEQNQRELE
jgi:chromosome segregation ATPase